MQNFPDAPNTAFSTAHTRELQSVLESTLQALEMVLGQNYFC